MKTKTKNPLFAASLYDRVGMLNDLLREFEKVHDLTMPSEYYAQPYNNDNLRDLTRHICLWLGVKPTYLTVQFADLKGNHYSYSHSHSQHTLKLDRSLATKPFYCVALVARGCTEYYLYRAGYTLLPSTHRHREIVDLATLHLGLSQLILHADKDIRGAVTYLRALLVPSTNYALQAVSFREYRELLKHR